ncbi:MAG: VWA domain-containing protein [Thermoanaerobaculia bacterium]
MPRHGCFKVAILLAALLPGLIGAQTPSAPPDRKGAVQTSADVTVVEIPVYVAGSNGRPVRGLTKADFELYDEGKRVEGFDLDVIDLEDFKKQTVTPDVPLPPAAQRHFFFLFDLTFGQPINVARARHAAVNFVQNTMKNGDLGAVATVDVEKGIKLVLSFTADRDQLSAALSTLSLPSLLPATADPLALTIFDPTSNASIVGGSGVAPGQTGNDAEWADILASIKRASDKGFDAYSQGRIQALSKELSGLARMLNSIHGRKNVVYFSEGFDQKLLSGVTGEMSGRTIGDQIVSGAHQYVDTTDLYGRSELRSALEEMYQVFKRNDCVIYTVDIAGLAPMPNASVEGSSSMDRGASTARLGSRGRGQDSLYAFAAETGGQLFKNSNDLGEHLEKLQEETALVYLITYSPAELKEPGRFRSLKVKVKASGAQVSSRAGYFEPRPWSKLTPAERRLVAAQQIAYGLPRTDIPARVFAAPILAGDRDGARVPVIVEIPGDTLVRQALGDKLNLEIYAYASDQKLRTKGFLSQSLSLDLARIGPQLSASGLKFYGEIFLPPGTYWLKVLIRIVETGRSGLMIVPVMVPSRENHQLFTVGPLFHETAGKWLMVKATAKPGSPAAGPYPFLARGDSFIPAADPVLDRAGETPLSLYVYNAPAGDEFDVRGEIRGKTGVRLGPAAISKVASSRDGGALNLLCSFRPEKLEKGSYTLWVGVRDQSTGSEGETLGFFEVR